MRITCNSLLEAPIINLIKLYQSLNVKGVCGIIVDGSKHNVSQTTIGSLTLLTYCNELEVSEHFNEKLALVDITIPKGGITYSSIADASNGLLIADSKLGNTPFAMATEDITFKLLIGNTSSEDTLLEQDLFNYVTHRISEGQDFTPIPMPLFNKRLLKFDVKREEGKSIISCGELSNEILAEVLKSVKVD